MKERINRTFALEGDDSISSVVFDDKRAGALILGTDLVVNFTLSQGKEMAGKILETVAEMGGATTDDTPCPECQQNREDDMSFCANCGLEL